MRFLAILVSVLLVGCGNPKQQQDAQYRTVSGSMLGTTYSVKAKTALSSKQIFEAMQRIDSEAKASMSIFNDSSLLSRINRNEIDTLDNHIAQNIALAAKVNALTPRYDITVKPLVEAYGFAAKNPESRPNVDSLIQFVGFSKFHLEGNRIVKEDPRLQLDLNSIAKGYTVDLVAERFEELGITDYMVNIGGEIRCKGYNAQGDRWSIAIETPYEGNVAMDSYEKIVRISDMAVATSGNYRRFYLTEDGEKVVHTISPKTGYSIVSTLLSATVIAPTCAEADAAATMFMSLGSSNDVERIAEQCNKDHGWDYYLIFAGDEDYRIVCSERLK